MEKIRTFLPKLGNFFRISKKSRRASTSPSQLRACVRKKRAFNMNQKTFVINFKGLVAARNCLRPKVGPLNYEKSSRVRLFSFELDTLEYTLYGKIIVMKSYVMNELYFFCSQSSHSINNNVGKDFVTSKLGFWSPKINQLKMTL